MHPLIYTLTLAMGQTVLCDYDSAVGHWEIVHVETGAAFPGESDPAEKFDPAQWEVRADGVVCRYSEPLLSEESHRAGNVHLYRDDKRRHQLVVKHAPFQTAADVQMLVAVVDGGVTVVPSKFFGDGKLHLMPLLDGDVGSMSSTIRCTPSLVDFMWYVVAQTKMAFQCGMLFCDLKLENFLWQRVPTAQRIDMGGEIEVMYGDVDSFMSFRNPSSVFFATYPYRRRSANTGTEHFENLLYGLCLLALAYFAAHDMCSMSYRTCAHDKMLLKYDRATSAGFLYPDHPYARLVVGYLAMRPRIVFQIESITDSCIRAMDKKLPGKKEALCKRAIDDLYNLLSNADSRATTLTDFY